MTTGGGVHFIVHQKVRAKCPSMCRAYRLSKQPNSSPKRDYTHVLHVVSMQLSIMLVNS